MSQDQIDILKRALQREKAARKAAEKILEDKSRELYHTSEELKESNLKLEDLLYEKSIINLKILAIIYHTIAYKVIT